MRIFDFDIDDENFEELVQLYVATFPTALHPTPKGSSNSSKIEDASRILSKQTDKYDIGCPLNNDGLSWEDIE